MRDFSLSDQASQPLGFASVIADMLASENVEQLLRIFLTNVGEQLNVDRVAVCRAIAPQQIRVLVDAIASDCKTIKNNIYPTKYFGFDSFQSCPRDRAIILTDTSQVTETLSIHQQWQSTFVRAMICAPILFDGLDPDSHSNVWGITIIQCHQPRQWQVHEAKSFWEITQALGECLQYWSLLIRSSELRSPNHNRQHIFIDQFLANSSNSTTPISSPTDANYFHHGSPESSNFLVPDIRQTTLGDLDDSDELQCTRVILTKMPDEMLSDDIQDEIATEIAIINNFGLTEDIESAQPENSNAPDPDNMLNQAINLAMQRLERYFDQHPEINDEIDAESRTEEDILENIAQLRHGSTENRMEYLQQKIIILIADLQQKSQEIVALRSQLQQLVKAQEEFRQIIVALQSENLPQSAQKAVIAIYNALQLKPNRGI